MVILDYLRKEANKILRALHNADPNNTCRIKITPSMMEMRAVKSTFISHHSLIN